MSIATRGPSNETAGPRSDPGRSVSPTARRQASRTGTVRVGRAPLRRHQGKATTSQKAQAQCRKLLTLETHGIIPIHREFTRDLRWYLFVAGRRDGERQRTPSSGPGSHTCSVSVLEATRISVLVLQRLSLLTAPDDRSVVRSRGAAIWFRLRRTRQRLPASQPAFARAVMRSATSRSTRPPHGP